MTAAIGMLGGCCGPCFGGCQCAGPDSPYCLMFQTQSSYCQALWAGFWIQQFGGTTTDFTTAYLVSTSTSSFAAVPSLGLVAASLVSVQTVNIYTGLYPVASNTYTPDEATYTARAAAEPAGGTNEGIVNTNTEYKWGIYRAVLGFTSTYDVTLSEANTQAAVDALAAALLAANPPTGIPWNQTWVFFYNADGSTSYDVGAGGPGFGTIATNMPLEAWPDDGAYPYAAPAAAPGTTASEQFAVFQTGRIEANFNYWFWYINYNGSSCGDENYVCYPNPLTPPTPVVTPYGLPADYGTTAYQSENCPPYPGTVGPCTGNPHPSCTGWPASS